MNNYEDWAHLVAKKLKGEADVIAAIEKDELDDAAATEAFVRTVLQPFLPENFGIGSGRVVDAYGNRSDHLDVVIYNRNFPRIGLRGTQSDYLYEAVLAAFAVRAKYVRKTFFESMDACASLARLKTNTDKTVLVQLAKRNGLKPGPNRSFVHEDPLRTTRFDLIGRPPVFMFGFTGIKGSYRQLQENLELWIEQRQQDQLDTPMRAFPAVIATQGCFAWRNAAPLALSNREMLGIGTDDAPIRLIVLQLLHLLNRRLHVTPDGFGLKPNLASYLSQFTPPSFEVGVGDIDELVTLRMKPADSTAADNGSRSTPARDHAPKATDKPAQQPPREAAASAPQQQPQPAAAAKPPAVKPEPPAVKPEPPAAEPEISAGVFDKPSPFASAPKPAVEEAQAEAPKPKAPVATLGSAPIPMDRSSDAAAKPPTAPLGSAPIPAAQPASPAADVIPSRPPVDIELTGETEIPEETQAEEPIDFESTMVIAPDASLSNRDSANSSNVFIDRVKQQMANGEAPAEKKKQESYTSTVPH